MTEVLTYVIEAVVGLATAGIGVGLARGGRGRVVPALLLLAGAAAVVHAAISLV